MPKARPKKTDSNNLKEFLRIKGFQEISLIDWDGKIASIIFLGGCNFRCGFCHSSSLVLTGDKLKNIPFESIERFLKTKSGWVDGVVITGGEPTLDEKQLSILASCIKRLGFLVKLDTNGSRPAVLRKLIESQAIDYIAMDIKAPLVKEAYQRAAQAAIDITDIIESKDIILNSGIEYEFRTTVVPGIINISDIANIARSIIPANKYCLQQFVARDTIDSSYLKLRPYPTEELYKMATIASEYLPNVTIRKN